MKQLHGANKRSESAPPDGFDPSKHRRTTLRHVNKRLSARGSLSPMMLSDQGFFPGAADGAKGKDGHGGEKGKDARRLASPYGVDLLTLSMPSLFPPGKSMFEGTMSSRWTASRDSKPPSLKEAPWFSRHHVNYSKDNFMRHPAQRQYFSPAKDMIPLCHTDSIGAKVAADIFEQRVRSDYEQFLVLHATEHAAMGGHVRGDKLSDKKLHFHVAPPDRTPRSYGSRTSESLRLRPTCFSLLHGDWRRHVAPKAKAAAH